MLSPGALCHREDASGPAAGPLQANVRITDSKPPPKDLSLPPLCKQSDAFESVLLAA